VVLVGCAHAGVVNTLHHVRELTGGKPIHAVAGGMHLASASRERIVRTMADLRELGVERIGPCHCTGAAAIAGLWNTFPGQCSPCGVGTKLEFEIP
jgi:7,8-dihydropterin-6-yl-methyl-4-(beta-D-ribofuranosyl)aminobenzene 5'-phosphate synthase